MNSVTAWGHVLSVALCPVSMFFPCLWFLSTVFCIPDFVKRTADVKHLTTESNKVLLGIILRGGIWKQLVWKVMAHPFKNKRQIRQALSRGNFSLKKNLGRVMGIKIFISSQQDWYNKILCVCACTHACAHTCVFVCVCVRVCACVFINYNTQYFLL